MEKLSADWLTGSQVVGLKQVDGCRSQSSGRNSIMSELQLAIQTISGALM